MFSSTPSRKKNWKHVYSHLVLIITILFIIVTPTVLGDNLVLNSNIRDNCEPDEVIPFSIYPLNNSHIAQPDYYPNKICLSGDNITSSTIKSSCNGTEGELLKLFGFNNTHAGSPSSLYPNITCVQCPVNSTVRTNCIGNETSILSLSDNSTNVHVGEPLYYPYQLCVIKTDPDVSNNTCICTMGNGYWNLDGEIDPDTCCEDDPNEYKSYKECYGNTCNGSMEDDACCDSEIDCVNNSICYSQWKTADTNTDQLNETCDYGEWVCNQTGIRESCLYLGYSNGTCISDRGNCAPDFSLESLPDRYYMPGEEVEIEGNFDDKEDDPIHTNISIRFPNGSTAVDEDTMNCTGNICTYNFSQTKSLGDYDVKIHTEGGGTYNSEWENIFSVNILNLTINFEEERVGGKGTQNIYGRVWREPYHTFEENANITIELNNKTYTNCDTTNSFGEYECEIDEPAFPREYKTTAYGIGLGKITGNISDFLKIISPRKVQVSMMLNFSIGSKKDNVYLGNEEGIPGKYTYPELEKSYICAEDSEEFSENVFVGLIPIEGVRTLKYQNMSSQYSFQSEERRLENKFLLAFSRGGCSAISNKYEQVQKEDFYNLFSPSISYPSKEKYKIYVILDYSQIDIRGDERFKKGMWDLFIENNGTHKGNTQINFDLLE
ncbi:MAG: hypothetical protein ABEK17_04085 [Candidatus Aenigmatarchaeota archaeon]